jgi:DNA-binding LytR/AlgR family response regulator
MPDISGMDMVKAMSDLPHIIITSSKENYALEAFEYDIIDYIKKPVTLPRLLKAIDKVAKSSTPMKKGNEGEVFVKVDSRFIKLKIQDIFFLESMGDYVVFHTENEKHTVHTTLKKIEEKLPADLFLKVHRSFVVNLKKIVDIEDNSLVINDKVIPISRTHKPQLFKKINIL